MILAVRRFGAKTFRDVGDFIAIKDKAPKFFYWLAKKIDPDRALAPKFIDDEHIVRARNTRRY